MNEIETIDLLNLGDVRDGVLPISQRSGEMEPVQL